MLKDTDVTFVLSLEEYKKLVAMVESQDKLITQMREALKGLTNE